MKISSDIHSSRSSNRGGRLIAGGIVLLLAAVVTSVCSSPPSSSTPPASSASGVGSPSTPASNGLTTAGAPRPIADLVPVVSVKELMEHMIDPLSDNIFDAVWWDTTAKGTVKHQPVTDEDWEKVRVGAVSIAEGIELLKIPRPFTPAGDVNNSTGPNPPELSPTQIQAKLDKDPVVWIAKIQALRNVSMEVLEVVKKKDVEALWAASADLDEACEACHLEYWYPGDLPAVLADRNARARFEKAGAKPAAPSSPAAPASSAPTKK